MFASSTDSISGVIQEVKRKDTMRVKSRLTRLMPSTFFKHLDLEPFRFIGKENFNDLV
jgi:hypothetical protein